MSARNPSLLHPLSSAVSSVIGPLNSALGGNGSCAVHASKRGLRLTLNGRTLVKGRTPDEFHAAFKTALEKAIKDTTA